MAVYLYDVSALHPEYLTGILVSETIVTGYVNNYTTGRKAVPFQAIDLVAKSDRTLRVYVKDPDLNVINLTSAVGVLTVKTDQDASVATFTKSTAVPAQGQIGAADEGEMFFYLLPADTQSLDIRQYVYDVRVTLSTAKTYIILNGVINLSKNIG